MTGKPSEQHLEEAMGWLLHLREAEGAEPRRRHAQWLASDPAHDLAWRQVNKAWALSGRTEAAGQAAAAPMSARNQPAHRMPPHQGPRMRWAAMAAAICLMLLGAVLLALEPDADHATATAEIRTVTLADGSHVQLGAETALDVEFDAASRRLDLLQGHAFFEVAPEPDRPFTVRAGELAVTVLGTAFDINLTDAAVTVAVKRGAVGVRGGTAGAPAAARQLMPGERLVLDRTTRQITLGRSQPEDIAGWVDGRLFVVDTPLSEVVAELRRYRPGWIVIADDVLAGRTVTGLYDLRSPDDALRAMLQPVGGTVLEVTPYLAIVARP